MLVVGTPLSMLHTQVDMVLHRRVTLRNIGILICWTVVFCSYARSNSSIQSRESISSIGTSELSLNLNMLQVNCGICQNNCGDSKISRRNINYFWDSLALCLAGDLHIFHNSCLAKRNHQGGLWKCPTCESRLAASTFGLEFHRLLHLAVENSNEDPDSQAIKDLRCFIERNDSDLYSYKYSNEVLGKKEHSLLISTLCDITGICTGESKPINWKEHQHLYFLLLKAAHSARWRAQEDSVAVPTLFYDILVQPFQKKAPLEFLASYFHFFPRQIFTRGTHNQVFTILYNLIHAIWQSEFDNQQKGEYTVSALYFYLYECEREITREEKKLLLWTIMSVFSLNSSLLKLIDNKMDLNLSKLRSEVMIIINAERKDVAKVELEKLHNEYIKITPIKIATSATKKRCNGVNKVITA